MFFVVVVYFITIQFIANKSTLHIHTQKMIKMDDDVATLIDETDQMTSSESIENSIEFTIARLNSNDDNVVIETIIQVHMTFFLL